MRLIILFFFYFLAIMAVAQQPEVTLYADTNKIKIGEQINLKLSAAFLPGYDIKWPTVPDTISNLEIISKEIFDTSKQGNNILVSQSIIITSFDSGYYVIPPFIFTSSRDTSLILAETEAMLVEVQTIPVDTTQAIKDIKAPLEVPLTIREVLPFLLGLIALVIIIYFIVRYFRNRKKVVKEPVKPVISISPYEWAMRELQKLEKEKLWKVGEVKLYYSRISIILRTFIENSFSIIALEMTTDEIISEMKNKNISQSAVNSLEWILKTSDLVKFAKYQPLPDEHHRVMKQSYEFIEISYPKQPVQQLEEKS